MKGIYAWMFLLMLSQHWQLEGWTGLLVWLMAGWLLVVFGRPGSAKLKEEWSRMTGVGMCVTGIGSAVCLGVVLVAMWRFW